MTAPEAQGRTTTPNPAEGPGTSPAQRFRFVATLVVFGAWVAALAVLAVRSDPPRPVAADDRPPGVPSPAPGNR